MISIPTDGFEVSFPESFKKKLTKIRKDFKHDDRFIERLKEVLTLISSNLFDPQLKFHSLSNKAKNLDGNIKYPYAITIQGKYRIAFYFDNGNTNPEINSPNSITLFYIGNYHY